MSTGSRASRRKRADDDPTQRFAGSHHEGAGTRSRRRLDGPARGRADRGVRRIMTRWHYLTARCPLGCESWLHPAAVRAHLEPGRCRRHPWVDDVTESVIVQGGSVRRPMDWVPARFVAGPRPDWPPLGMLNGEEAIAISSPIQGVAPREWLQVVEAALAVQGTEVVARALDPVCFSDLRTQYGQPGRLVVCDHCGCTVERRGLTSHQARSARCHWARAAGQVRLAWAACWRDPFRLGGDTPLSWTELQRTVQWRNRVGVVSFPQWAAVLVAPADWSGPRTATEVPEGEADRSARVRRSTEPSPASHPRRRR